MTYGQPLYADVLVYSISISAAKSVTNHGLICIRNINSFTARKNSK